MNYSSLLDENAVPCIRRDKCFYLTIVLNSAFSSSDILVLLSMSYTSAVVAAATPPAQPPRLVQEHVIYCAIVVDGASLTA